MFHIFLSAWIDNADIDGFARDLNLRVSAVTSLDTRGDYAEHLQVAVYGMGGMYEPHRDYNRVGAGGVCGFYILGLCMILLNTKPTLFSRLSNSFRLLLNTVTQRAREWETDLQPS